MINKLINKLFSQKVTEDDIECAIDENIVDCKTFDDEQEKAYVGVPAPILNPVDDWFSSPYGFAVPAITQKQKDYMHKRQRSRNRKKRIVSIGRKNLLTFIKRCIIWQPRVVPLRFNLIPLVDPKTSKVVQKMSIDDWRYNDQKMKVREQALKVLLSKFGGQMEGVRPKYSSQSIYGVCSRLGIPRQHAHCRDCKILRGLLCKN